MGLKHAFWARFVHRWRVWTLRLGLRLGHAFGGLRLDFPLWPVLPFNTYEFASDCIGLQQRTWLVVWDFFVKQQESSQIKKVSAVQF